jgi:hypothetical protein
MNAAQLGLVILAAAEVPNFLAGLLPSLFTIRTFSSDPEKVQALRRGEVVGSALSLGVGAGASLVAKRIEPLLACLAVLGVLLWEYERAIRNPIGAPLDMAAGATSRASTAATAPGRPR